MDIRKIKKLIELIKETGIGEIEVKTGDDSVRISRMPSLPAVTQVTAAMPLKEESSQEIREKMQTIVEEIPEGHAVKAPMVGTVYVAPTPGAKPFVEVGQHVAMGDTLCLIEAMKMFNEIPAGVSGKIVEVLVKNEEPVDVNRPLFKVAPN